MKTRHCVLLVDADIYSVKENNQKTNTFSPELLQDLWNRMERPNEKNRWDKPLFGILPEDEIPFEQIHEALFKNPNKMKNNPTTGPKTKLGNSYTYEIDKVVTDTMMGINKALLENKKMMNQKYIVFKEGKNSL